MSATGQWRMRVQDTDDYRAGYALEPAGDRKGDALFAWSLGRDDHQDDDQPRPGEP